MSIGSGVCSRTAVAEASFDCPDDVEVGGEITGSGTADSEEDGASTEGSVELSSMYTPEDTDVATGSGSGGTMIGPARVGKSNSAGSIKSEAKELVGKSVLGGVVDRSGILAL